MPRADILSNNFRLGELSPEALGQLNTEIYRAGAQVMTNFLPGTNGGAFVRPGTKYVANAYNASRPSFLHTFVYSQDEAYILEFGYDGSNNKCRIYNAITRAVITTLTIGVPGIEMQFAKIAQIGNTVFFASELTGHPIGIQRVSAASWTSIGLLDMGSILPLVSQQFLDGPYRTDANTLDDGTVEDTITLTPNGTTSGADRSTTLVQLQASSALFLEEWEGRNIRLKASDGSYTWMRLVTYTDSTHMTGYIRGSDLPNTTAISTWYLGLTDTNADPEDSLGCRAIGFVQDRLVLAGFTLAPNLVVMSKNGVYTRFPFNENDDGAVDDNTAIYFRLNTSEAEDIVWVLGVDKGLLVGTTGGVHYVTGPDDGSKLTPSNFNIRRLSSVRLSGNFQPLAFGDRFIAKSQSERNLIELDINRKPIHRPLAIQNQHLFDYKIAQIQKQELPDSRIWMNLTADEPENSLSQTGQGDDVFQEYALVGPYDAENSLLGLAKVVLGGANATVGNPVIESIATVPVGDRDDVWFQVKRYINGSVVRTLEYLTPEYRPPGLDYFADTESALTDFRLWKANFVDCAVTFGLEETVLSISKANPGVVETNIKTTQFQNGDLVKFVNVGGMTELEYDGTSDTVYTLANKSGNTFELSGENTTGNTTFIFSQNCKMVKVYQASSGISAGAAHLASELVSVVADGEDLGTQTLNGSGDIVLSGGDASYYGFIQVGYPYTATLRLGIAEGGGATGTALGKTQRIHRVSVKLVHSRNFNAYTKNLRYNPTIATLSESFTDNRNGEFNDSNSRIWTGVHSFNVEAISELDDEFTLTCGLGPFNLTALTRHLSTQDR